MSKLIKTRQTSFSLSVNLGAIWRSNKRTLNMWLHSHRIGRHAGNYGHPGPSLLFPPEHCSHTNPFRQCMNVNWIDIWCRLFFQPLVSSQVAPVSSIERWLGSVAAPSSPWLDSHHYADPQVEPWGGNKYIFSWHRTAQTSQKRISWR